MRKLNFLFLFCCVAVLALGAAAFYVLHRVQLRRNASALLEQARRVEESGNLEKAAELLARYLSLNREDGQAWSRYARVVDRNAKTPAGREFALQVCDHASRMNEADQELASRCAEIALEVDAPAIARSHLESLLGRVKDDPGKAAETARFEDMLGQCYELETNFDLARKSYEASIEHDRSRVETYERLARMLWNKGRAPEQAERRIDEMVASNPAAARALIARWRFRRDHRLPAAESDVARALELDANDAIVVRAAAETALAKHDLAGARAHLERGLKQHPAEPLLFRDLARTESADKRPEQAEAVLRRGIAAAPSSIELKFLLAESLIDQGKEKLDGPDGSGSWIQRLQADGLNEGLVHYLRAREQRARGEWREAIETFGAARTLLASSPEMLAAIELFLAECHQRLAEPEQVMASLERAARSERDGTASRLALAARLEETGRLEEAYVIHKELAASRPESALELARLSLLRTAALPREQRQWEKTEQLLRDAERRLPSGNDQVARLRIDLAAQSGRYQEARALAARAVAASPRNVELRIAQARLAEQENRLPEAQRILDQAEAELGASLALLQARLALLRRQGGDLARAALVKLEEARSRLPASDQAACLELLARTELLLGRNENARRYWNELAALPADRLPSGQRVKVLLELFDLSLLQQDRAESERLVQALRQAEGEREGSYWRFAEASLLLDRYRARPAARGTDGSPEGGDLRIEIQRRVAEVSRLRPGWWGGPLLEGQLAELNGTTDEAVGHYLKVLDAGDIHPMALRIAAGMIARSPGARKERLAQLLSALEARGVPVEDLGVGHIVNSILSGDVAGGLELARRLYPATSPRYSDHLLMARIDMAAGRHDEAVADLRRAVELAPGVPETWISYVEELASVGQPQQAAEVIARASTALPADQADLTLARCWMILGEMGKAETLYLKAFRERRDDPLVLQSLVEFLLRQQRLAEAGRLLDLYEKKLDLSAEARLWARRMRATLLTATGRLEDQDRALEIVEENLKQSGGSPTDLRMKVSVLALRPGRRRDAVKVLEELVAAARPPSAPDQFYLAQLYLHEGMTKQYEARMAAIVGEGKANLPGPLAHFSGYLLDRSRPDEAQRYVALLKRVDPNSLATLGLEARLLDARRLKDQLLALLQDFGRRFPDQIGAVADLLTRFGLTSEAEKAYRTYVARRPDQPDRALALAMFLGRQGRSAEAMDILGKAWTSLPRAQVVQAALPVLESPAATQADRARVEGWLKEAMTQQPSETWLKIRFAQNSLQAGRIDEAATALREVLEKSPDDGRALNNLAWILGMAEPPRSDEALRLIDRAVMIMGSNPSLADTRAVILIRAGRYDEAIDQLRAAQAMSSPAQSPSLPRTLLVHLAWAHSAKGMDAEARALLQQAEAGGYRAADADPLERPFILKLQRTLTPGQEPAPKLGGPALAG